MIYPFSVEYKIPHLRLPVKQHFNTIKTATQYVRRNRIKNYRLYAAGELAIVVDGKLFTLSRLKSIVKELESTLLPC